VWPMTMSCAGSSHERAFVGEAGLFVPGGERPAGPLSFLKHNAPWGGIISQQGMPIERPVGQVFPINGPEARHP
jgi:hypothetical protein